MLAREREMPNANAEAEPLPRVESRELSCWPLGVYCVLRVGMATSSSITASATGRYISLFSVSCHHSLL